MKRYLLCLTAIVITVVLAQYIHHNHRVDRLAKEFEPNVQRVFYAELEAFMKQSLHDTTSQFCDNYKDFYYLSKTFPNFKHDGNLTFSCNFKSGQYHHLFTNRWFMVRLLDAIPDWHEEEDLQDEERIEILIAIFSKKIDWLVAHKLEVELPGLNTPTTYKNAAGIRDFFHHFKIVPDGYISNQERGYQRIETERLRLRKMADKMYVSSQKKTFGKNWAKHEQHWGQYHVPRYQSNYWQLYNSSEGAELRKLERVSRMTPFQLYQDYEALKAKNA